MSNKPNGHKPILEGIDAAQKQVPPAVAPGQLATPSAVWTQVAAVEGPAGKFVVLRSESANGMNVVFLSPEHARELAAELDNAARAISSGLHVAGVHDMPPDVVAT